MIKFKRQRITNNHMMTNLITKVRRWTEERRERLRERYARELAESFYIEERGGRIFIMHDGVAIAVYFGTVPTDTITKQLQRAKVASAVYLDLLMKKEEI